MNSVQYFAFIISLSIILGFFSTSRLSKLPSTITILITSIVLCVIVTMLPDAYLTDQIRALTHNAIHAIDYKTLLIDGLLAFLLFAGAVHLPYEDIFESWLEISVLAIIATVLSVLIVGELTYHLVNSAGYFKATRIEAYLFGAIISPTDPVAVLGMIKRLNGPASLSAKVAGESLFNDGVGIVIFTVLLGLHGTGANFEIFDFTGDFLYQSIGGVAMGLILSRVTQKMIEV